MPDKRRVAQAFATLIADRYHAARSSPVPGALEYLALEAGVDLLRSPRLAAVFAGPLQRGPLLREIWAPLYGRETLYLQLRDLFDLLRLQFYPIPPDIQRASAQWLAQEWGIRMHPSDIVRMTLHETEAAITRLVGSIAPDASPLTTQWLSACVPRVLSTVHKVHKGWGTPAQLPPPRFVEWFNERLLLTAKVKLERFPHNPLWTAPDGRPTHAPMATSRDYQEYGQWGDLICQLVRLPRGRPRGSGTYPTRDELLQDLRQIIQSLRHEGVYPSQPKVAARLRTSPSERQLREWLHGFTIDWNDMRNSP